MAIENCYDPKPESTTESQDNDFWASLVDDCPIIASDDY